MNDEVGGPVNLARIYLVVGAGLPVCTGIVVFALAFTGYEFLATEPFAPRSDLVETWAFAVPAAVVLFLCRRVYARVRRTQDSGPLAFLARLVPLLILIGIAGGAWMTNRILKDALRTRQMLERMLCDDVFSYREGSRDWAPPPGDGDPRLTACLPEAHRCDRERRREDLHSSVGGFHPDRDQRPEIVCLRKAGNAAGWLH